MRKVALMFLVVLAVFVASAAVAGDFTYVGDKKCKGCHKDVHTAWGETGHATTFDRLNAEQKKDAKCVKCHSTGTLADGTLLEGVQCESCHGPGSEYKSPKIMSKKKWAADPEAQKKLAVEAGLVYPVEKDCVVCHTKEGNDNFKEFVFKDRVGAVHKVAEEEAPAEE